MMSLDIVLLPPYDKDPVMNHYRHHTHKNEYDAGVDVIVPHDIKLVRGINHIQFGIKCRHAKCLTMKPRSSIAKLPIRVKNVITFPSLTNDKTFSDEVRATVYCNQESYEILSGTRLFQLINHDLTPMRVNICSNVDATHAIAIETGKILTIKIKTDDTNLQKHYQQNDTCHDNIIKVILPTTIELKPGVNVIKLGIACEPMQKCGFLLCQNPHPNVAMCNDVGIIDYGYRGELLAKVDYVDDKSMTTLPAGMELFYLTNPGYDKLLVELTDELATSDRGTGGFGSTGTGADDVKTTFIATV